jgi:hypothetical protein
VKRLVPCAILFALLTTACCARAAEDLRAYAARLDRWQASLGSAHQLLARGDPTWRSAAQAIAVEAARGTRVERTSGGAITVSHAWLADEVRQALSAESARQKARALEQAEQSLSFYRASLRPAPAVNRSRMKAALARALPTRERARPLRLAWLGRLLERLADWLARAFGWMDRAPKSARWLAWAIIGLLGAALLFLLGLAARAVLRRFAPEKSGGGPRVEVGMPWAPPDADAVLARARQAAAAGAFGDAIRRLYLAFLLKLDGLGLVRYHPATANWEYFRGLPGADLRREFASFTVIFDRKCYGAQAAARDDYDRCEELFARALGAAGV